MRRSPNTAALLLALVAFSAPLRADAEPRFGIEVAAGQNVGFTSYVDNIVVLQGDLPLLADDLPGSGLALRLHFLFNAWAVGAKFRLFDRDTIRLHHRGTSSIPSGRIRADGSVDDSGIVYEEFGPVRSPSPSIQPGDLMVIEIGTARRFYLLDATYSLWLSGGGNVVATKILETSQPTILGLGATGGLGMSYTVAPPIGVVLQGEVAGVLTPAYRPLSDAARGSYAAGETTEEAVFSSMAYASVTIGLQFTIR